jgi:hypothetical protein
MDKNIEYNMFGCYCSFTSKWDDNQKAKDALAEQGKLFRTYIWGENSISVALKKLLILFEFYVNPLPFQIPFLKRVRIYRKKEKSAGIPIIIDGDNFFKKTESQRRQFLRDLIFESLCLVENIVQKKKLDTDIVKLRKDLERIL